MDSGVDAVWVIGRAEDFFDAVSIFDEVESRSGTVQPSSGGLFRLFFPVSENSDLEGMLEVLRQAERLREASHWLMWPVYYHPNMQYGEENVLLGTTQQFANGFTRRFGSEPTLLSAFAANSCLNLRQAIEIAAAERPSVPTSAEIVAGLANISAETVRATISILSSVSSRFLTRSLRLTQPRHTVPGLQRVRRQRGRDRE